MKGFKIKINRDFILQLFITIILLLVLGALKNYDFANDWSTIVSRVAIITFIMQMFFVFKSKRGILSFTFWFIIFSYLFMFGQIFLTGLLGIEKIEALGYTRNVLDIRYDNETMYKSSLFIIGCIQIIFLFLIFRKHEKSIIEIKYDRKLYGVAKILLLIGIPCHLFYSVRMIIMGQTAGSYDAITDMTGLIDDFANLMIYGLICLLFSHKLNQKQSTCILFLSTIYLVIIMVLTGDRRYQIVSIIVLLLSYWKAYNYKFKIKDVGLIIIGYLLLSLFYVLREIRTSELVSIGSFLVKYKSMVFDVNTNIMSQTLYEFGGSFYTVCLAFKYIPFDINFQYGNTILSGIISILPFGFMYKDLQLFKNGRLATILMEQGNTTVGGSVYADLYGNFGILGGIIFAGVLGIIFYNLFNKKVKDDKLIGFYSVRYYILFFSLIHLVRASFTEVIRTAVWGIGILYFLYMTRKEDKYEQKNIKQ